jgi:hypothetical protein
MQSLINNSCVKQILFVCCIYKEQYKVYKDEGFHEPRAGWDDGRVIECGGRVIQRVVGLGDFFRNSYRVGGCIMGWGVAHKAKECGAEGGAGRRRAETLGEDA